jgi:hypothetical protein
MIVRAAGPPDRRIILFNYEASRTVASLQGLLIGPQGPYTGKLLTDGLDLYENVAEALKLVHCGCLQHCRTYYHKAAKVTELPPASALGKALSYTLNQWPKLIRFLEHPDAGRQQLS